MARGGICWQERTILVISYGNNLTAQRVIDDILRSFVLSFLHQQSCGVYQDDNDRHLQPESYKTSLEPTTSTCSRGLYARQTCPQ